jgi:hypothetical protein
MDLMARMSIIWRLSISGFSALTKVLSQELKL